MHLLKSTSPIAPSEITPEAVYRDRRAWLSGAAGSALALGSLALPALSASAQTAGPGRLTKLAGAKSGISGASVAEALTSYDDATSYNNYYEFGTDKADPRRYAHTLRPRPWSVAIEGLVAKPQVFDLEDLQKLAPMEERIYRMRCVEGWSMVLPWVGYSLSELIKKVQPLGSAKFVEFVTLADKAQMPGVRSGMLDWPYTEGLRMDEALHPLTLLSFGLYGEVLPNQNGAPVRLTVPWKYGFKSAKSLVKIRFVEKQPVSSWERANPQEYGFYSNVNPQVDHPRWSQASERRIGDSGGPFARRKPTLMFNGYEPQVGQLYAGMDLKKFY